MTLFCARLVCVRACMCVCVCECVRDETWRWQMASGVTKWKKGVWDSGSEHDRVLGQTKKRGLQQNHFLLKQCSFWDLVPSFLFPYNSVRQFVISSSLQIKFFKRCFRGRTFRQKRGKALRSLILYLGTSLLPAHFQPDQKWQHNAFLSNILCFFSYLIIDMVQWYLKL